MCLILYTYQSSKFVVTTLILHCKITSNLFFMCFGSLLDSYIVFQCV